MYTRKKRTTSKKSPTGTIDSVFISRQPVMFDTLADAFGTTLTSVVGL